MHTHLHTLEDGETVAVTGERTTHSSSNPHHLLHHANTHPTVSALELASMYIYFPSRHIYDNDIARNQPFPEIQPRHSRPLRASFGSTRRHLHLLTKHNGNKLLLALRTRQDPRALLLFLCARWAMVGVSHCRSSAGREPSHKAPYRLSPPVFYCFFMGRLAGIFGLLEQTLPRLPLPTGINHGSSREASRTLLFSPSILHPGVSANDYHLIDSSRHVLIERCSKGR